jgi:hypothetical protein
MSNAVTQVPAADPTLAIAHFESEFAFETDCWDTHEALKMSDPGFVLVDARHAARREILGFQLKGWKGLNKNPFFGCSPGHGMI